MMPPVNIIGSNFKLKLLNNGQSPLYNGFEYIGYAPNYFKEGHPFFKSDAWRNGSLIYDGKRYVNIPMLYDLISDEVIIQHFNKTFKITLLKSRLEMFNIDGHHFIRQQINEGKSQNQLLGFYEQLYNKKTILLVKRVKKINESVTTEGVTRNVVLQNKYFILKDGKYAPVDGQSGMINILKDKKQEIEAYIKTSRINFKQDQENAMINIVDFYDRLNK